MTESGKVISTDGEYAVVRIERRSACASCGKCGMTEGQKHADIRVMNKCSAAVGEYAEISMGDRAIFLSSAIVYLIPLLGAAAGLIVGNFLKNDVVVYKANGKLQVGRILGQETDVITIDDTGQLLVNGTPQTGEIAFPTYAKKGIKKFPNRVPKGCVFLLGDYRTQTKDSRDYGPIKMEAVKAKVITVLRRREL